MMTTYEDVKRASNVIYLPTKKQSGLPVAILVGAVLASFAAAVGFMIWSFVAVMFSLA
ncbi:MAG: hypothetical protein ACYC2K_01690 [Gemmatimonadales bacterium]